MWHETYHGISGHADEACCGPPSGAHPLNNRVRCWVLGLVCSTDAVGTAHEATECRYKKGRFLPVGEQDGLLLRILRGTSDANIPFDGLCQLLRRLGFAERIRGSHHIFTKEGVEEILNL